MSSIEERLQIKREPLDKWSIREQLALAVARNMDQNLTSVSRALKPFGEPNRPPDWFHQKNCAAQYGALLANVETPKRKKRTSGGEVTIETPAEVILRKLLAERKAELKRLLAEEKAEYQKLQRDKALLQSGNVSEEQLDIWCKEIDEEEQRKEQETIAHEQWLKERELRKQEIERAWRPVKPPPVIGQKRKNSEAMDTISETENTTDEQKIIVQDPPKPALSPLLTSLLKSPSQVPNVTTSSILHSAITNQRPTNTTTNTSPMIASLLNSSTGETVSPGLQLLVSTAIGQEPTGEEAPPQQNVNTNDILDDANLQILKIDDLASSILIQNGPLPEIKNDVDVIISDLIENAQDIVADPEQHLQLDGNGDINLNLELEDFEESETDMKEETKETEKRPETTAPTIDPFEFQEDPEVFEPTKPTTATKTDASKTVVPQNNEDRSQLTEEVPNTESKQLTSTTEEESTNEIVEVKNEPTDDTDKKEKNATAGSVEIVEVVVMDDEDIDKDLNKTQIEDIVHSVKVEPKEEIEAEKAEVSEIKSETEDTLKLSEKDKQLSSEETEKKLEPETNLDVPKSTESTTLTPDFNEELYDDINMEVKVDKTGKAKRDYSRTKKKDDKEFDVLLAIEKAQRDESELVEESFSDRDFSELDRKDSKSRIKSENERSNSPWTEEEDVSTIRTRRRLSTPATPIDSVPGSPVSSIYFYDDDREYRNWKKSIMLVYSRLAANKYASLFSKPITDDQAPGYHSVVYRPMDLLTIRKNIENGAIRTTQEFQRDVLLMLNNAIMYNKTNDTVYNMARQMQQESMQQIQILLQAQSQDLPVRRETRTSEPGCKRKRGTEENSRSKKRKDD
ncbi:bromodomain-containing protein 8 [Tribolium madens]|uniref:bromodomain-containing protein 8 n=1 Tax=Tribolium madens TaxID=41895 RepID=UPI001CF73A15|nr:bromodomain-containing protein 8 [Tribolium madens]